MLSAPISSDDAVTITDFTHSVVDGFGVFDLMMKSVKAHLEMEWTAGRIKGNEYSTIYLGAMQTTMATALQFVLSKDKTAQEIALLNAQLTKTKEETAFVVQKTKTELAQLDGTAIGDTSVLGRANGAVLAQTNGYARHAEQQAAKLMIDAFNIQVVANDATINSVGLAQLDAPSIGSVIAKLKAGVP